MSEWWTYRLSDLILFSPDVYYRTFALYHHRIWPAHLILLGIVAPVGWFVLRSDRSAAIRGRVIAGFLAACWFWTGLLFHLGTYATINWMARYFALAFVLQAMILLWHGVLRGGVELDLHSARTGGLALILIASAAPLAGILSGRGWNQVEFLGLTPDPTAVATIVLLRLSSARGPRFLLVIPVVWCLVGGLTLYGLDSPEAWWTWASASVALFIPALAGSGSRALNPEGH